MAVRKMRLCDSCGKLEAARTEVLSFDAKIGDGTRVVGDLCKSCLGKLIKEHNLTTTTKRRRSAFTVKTVEEIEQTKKGEGH